MGHWTDDATDPYLRGFYRPVSEEREETDLKIEGEIPAGLRGTFLKNGPNQRFAPLGRFHPFDGDGMLHALYLKGGRARYKNRYVRTAGFEFETQLGRNAYGGFADLRMPLPEALAKVGPFKNVANTSIVRHADKLLALWEGGMPTIVDAELETKGLLSFAGQYEGSFTAHPRVDPRTGELVAFGYSAFPPYLTFLVLDKTGALIRKEPIELARPVMMHDFAVSRDHVIFLDAPAVFALNDAMSGKGDIIQWQPQHGCRLGVLPREGTNRDVRWFPIEPCYVYHFMNAHEEDGQIHVDAGRLERLNTFGLASTLTDPPITLTRFSIDLAKGEVNTRSLDERSLEFPRIHDGRVGGKYNVGYAATFSGARNMADYDTTLRYDLARGTAQSYFHGAGRFVGELVHAPDPQDPMNEDAGWLLGFVYDSARDMSELVVFAAANIRQGPLARVFVNSRVPAGIHAAFVPETI
jgi:carotenoid cleavage dioxygenase